MLSGYHISGSVLGTRDPKISWTAPALRELQLGWKWRVAGVYSYLNLQILSDSVRHEKSGNNEFTLGPTSVLH